MNSDQELAVANLRHITRLDDNVVGCRQTIWTTSKNPATVFLLGEMHSTKIKRYSQKLETMVYASDEDYGILTDCGDKFESIAIYADLDLPI